MSRPPLEALLPRGQTLMPHLVVVQFDGACEPPGTGGIATYGFTIDGEGYAVEECGLAVRPGSPTATNNVAEYAGAIRALEWLVARQYAGPVVVRGDSQLVVRQMTGEYQVRADHLRAYHERLAQLAAKFEEVRFEWVPREENQRADALSKQAIRDVQRTAPRGGSRAARG